MRCPLAVACRPLLVKGEELGTEPTPQMTKRAGMRTSAPVALSVSTTPRTKL